MARTTSSGKIGEQRGRDLAHDGTAVAGSTTISSGGQIGLDWKLSGAGDVTGGGRVDIVWSRPSSSSVIWALQGNGDVTTGGPDQDTFPFNALNELGKVVTDFQAGSGGDILDFHNLLALIDRGATDAFTDGTIRAIQHGAMTEVQIDTRPGQHDWLTTVTLQDITATSLVRDNFLV